MPKPKSHVECLFDFDGISFLKSLTQGLLLTAKPTHSLKRIFGEGLRLFSGIGRGSFGRLRSFLVLIGFISSGSAESTDKSLNLKTRFSNFSFLIHLGDRGLLMYHVLTIFV